MFKKSIFIGLGMFVFMFCTTLIFQSCRPCENKICNFEFNVQLEDSLSQAYNLNTTDGTDTSLNKLSFEFYAFEEVDNPACAYLNFGFNTAYAFTQYCEVTNDILDGSFILQLDQDLTYNGNTIAAGTNLITQADLKDHWSISSDNFGKGSSGQIFGQVSLDSNLMSQIQFNTGSHDVSFGFATDDGQNLLKHKNVVFEL